MDKKKAHYTVKTQIHHTQVQTHVWGCVYPECSPIGVLWPINKSQISLDCFTRCSIVPFTSFANSFQYYWTLHVRVWEGECMQTASCSYFLLYSHPLQLSEKGCMPPPTPIALPSITLRWQWADTSSHTHSELNITLLQSTTTAIVSHISPVQFREHLCHKLYFGPFSWD